jgi:hypothetical protein
MSDEELARAVTDPARVGGLRLEPGLVDLILRDVAREPGALPLLSHALRATWEQRDGRTLTVEGYRASGGVASAIAQTADSIVHAVPPDRQRLLRNLFLRLTELGEGIEDTRRRVAVGELVVEGASPDDVQALLERLAEARLITLGDGTAEVAHEVLVREWPTLRAWLEEDRIGIRLHRQLGDAARLWDVGGRQTGDLYRGTRLAGAVEWAQSHADALNATERAFLDASIAESDRARRMQLRANRRLRALLVGVVLLLVAAVIAGALALRQGDRARASARSADAQRLGAEALIADQPDRSLLLAQAGRKLDDSVATRGYLLSALVRRPAAIGVTQGDGDPLTALALNPGNRILAAGDDNGTVFLLDARTRVRIGPPLQLNREVGGIDFSPAGSRRSRRRGTGRAEREARRRRHPKGRSRDRRGTVSTRPRRVPPNRRCSLHRQRPNARRERRPGRAKGDPTVPPAIRRRYWRARRAWRFGRTRRRQSCADRFLSA